MYTINKIVGYLISPAGFSMALVGAAVLARVFGRRRLAGGAVVLALANFWIWSTPWMTQKMGVALEAEFLVEGRVPAVESLPEAEAIVLHGGGMGIATNLGYQAEMWNSADRVWQAARVWRDQVKRKKEKGKSADVKILVSGLGAGLSTGPLLADFGVPTNAVVFIDEPRNTEEEAKAVEKVSGGRFQVSGFRFQVPGEKLETCNVKLETTRPKVLVVTSAWHMKRTMLMYQKYAPGVEAVPAPCDFENTVELEGTKDWLLFFPSPTAFLNNSAAFKEWLGYFGYRYLR